MFKQELSNTLIDLIESVQAPEKSGLIVTEAELDVPLEIGSAMRDDKMILLGSVAHSRWKAGFLPPVTMSKIRVVLDSDI